MSDFDNEKVDGQSKGEVLLNKATNSKLSEDERASALAEFKKYAPDSNDPRIAQSNSMKANPELSSQTYNILADTKAGQAVGQSMIPDGSLGRVSESRNPELADIIAKRKAQLTDNSGQVTQIQGQIDSLGQGLNAEQLQAYRDNAVRQIARSNQGAQRSLQASQASNGVNGASASAQQVNLQIAANQQRADFERDLFLKQRDSIMQDQQQQAALRNEQIGLQNADANRLGSFETSTQSAISNEQSQQKFNLDQAARERFGQLSTALGIASLGVAERGGDKASAAAAAAGNIKSGGK